jgi:hypothetical protein
MLVAELPTRSAPAGGHHQRALGVALAWYAAMVAGYLGAALALPELSVACTSLHCARSARHLMLTVGAGVGLALLLCAALISVVVVSADACRARSAVALGTRAAGTGLGGALLFLAAAVLLHIGL